MKKLFYLTLTLSFLIAHGSLSAQTSTSYYVPVGDSTLLAVDVHFPSNYKNDTLPVLAAFGRYWRATMDRKQQELKPPLDGRDQFFSENGYIIVKVDVRGTGASFGTRAGEYTPQEVMDAAYILDWIVAQTWCDGNIGSYGTSYEGTTAELLCATNHPAVKAVIPGWSDFDVYRSPVRPYGMLASGFIRKWGMYVHLLDNNNKTILRERVRYVSKDLIKAAVAEHKDNPDVYKITKNGPYRNSHIGEYTYEHCSPVHWKDEIEKSNVPMLVLTSWMDAGTAEGTLLRLQHFSNSQKVLMMATCHGGWSHASPFVVSDELMYPVPRIHVQDTMQLVFLDHYLKGAENNAAVWPTIKYYNMGEEAYKESDVWPVAGTSDSLFYFEKDGLLSGNLPTTQEAADAYKVDFSATTGKKNRWTTQMGGPVINLDNRNAEDAKMLVYTTPPMEEDLQITGTPIIYLSMSSTHTDGAVFVYLEDVDENGVSRYITEGGLRLIHRKPQTNPNDPYNAHSFNEEDAALLVPDSVENVMFKLWPTSVLIKKGHSLRIAIAGADKDTFDKLPKKGKPTLTIHRSAMKPSYVELPIVR
jgi:putative CocE/NonD family hydrolase